MQALVIIGGQVAASFALSLMSIQNLQLYWWHMEAHMLHVFACACGLLLPGSATAANLQPFTSTVWLARAVDFVAVIYAHSCLTVQPRALPLIVFLLVSDFTV
jgi:hypothetical protein